MAAASLEWVDQAWNKVIHKVAHTSSRIGAGFPHASVGGMYQLEPPHWWTAGFWPGLLWLLYRDTKHEAYRKLAETCESQLDDVMMNFDRLDHDIGFMWTLTSVARYKLLGSDDARRKGLLAASLLMGRYNEQGRYIRAWNPWREGENNSGEAIIDCLMNLPLLFWATDVSGDPRYLHVARRHAETVLEHFIRPDGSVYHIVIFDAWTGDKIGVRAGQGFAAESAWSRGAAWAIYGLALCYRSFADKRYLQAAKQVAHFFIANLPEDRIPFWDFRLPPNTPAYRDSSAGACAASGLLLLAKLVPSVESRLYCREAERILESLYFNYGAWDDPAEEGLILHGTSNYPEDRNIDVPLIYGDYFFVEGLAHLKGFQERFW
jgi:unsaturated chondroitin disaccharide hydrolase